MSGADVHPSAIGTGIRPDTSSDSSPTSQQYQSSNSGFNETEYPEQRHAGAVGYGPNYAKEATLSDKVSGIKEEIKGKVSKNPALVEQGKKRRTGELKYEQAARDDQDSFATPDEREDKQQSVQDTHSINRDRSNFEQAAIVAPEGSHQAETQRRGDAVSHMKHIGA